MITQHYQQIRFDESGCSVRSLESQEDRFQSYRLRHKVFCEQLRWVPVNTPQLEIDRYDQVAVPLGVFSDTGVLVGFVRFLPSHHQFMLESEFAGLVAPGYQIRKAPDTVEISRLAVAPDAPGTGRSRTHFSILLKGLYQWSINNSVRYAYMEVEKRFFRVLHALGFPCVPIGPFTALPPAGAESVAAILDWTLFRTQNATKRPAFLAWMSTTESARDAAPAPWPGPASRPAVSREYSGREISQYVH
ncbi:MAG: acyl-homoserine-lactone synthase [Nitrospirota bacterium]